MLNATRPETVLPRRDQLDGPLAWPNADPASLPATVKIRFLLNGARLYSYRWR